MSNYIADGSYSGELSIVLLRWTSVLAVVLIGFFIPGDLIVLPDTLYFDYYARTIAQWSSILLYILYSFHPSFKRYRQSTLLLIVIILTYLNYYFIYLCWTKAAFRFPYEGVLLYSFFSLFIVRLEFKLSIIYVLFNIVGFGILVTIYPIYGEYGHINLGFVVAAQVIGLFGSYQLSTSFRKNHTLTENLKIQSRTDQLTGLLNRRAYEEEASKLLSLSLRSKSNFSIFLIDIDDFKVFNDTYGHIRGDEVIRVQSDLLLDCFKRQSDVIGRYGGEEFIVFASNMNMNKLLEMGQELIEGWSIMNIENKLSRSADHVSCSIGIYTAIPENDSNIHQFILKADEALYSAKHAGRNCVKILSQTDKRTEVTSKTLLNH